MYVKALALLLICNYTFSKEQSFFFQTNKRWSFSFDYRVKTDVKNLLFEIDFYDKNMNKVTDCIFHKKRLHNKEGQVIVTEKTDEKCSEGSHLITQIEVFNFKYRFYQSSLIFYIDKKEERYNFYNFGNRKTLLYGSAIEETKISGVKIGAQVSSMTSKPLLKDGVICKKVENDCSYSISKDCKRCKSGSYKLIDSACMDDYTQICGEDKCGEKNRPACIRGKKTTGVDPRFYCIADSPFAFCSTGLRVFCENQVLVCK